MHVMMQREGKEVDHFSTMMKIEMTYKYRGGGGGGGNTGNRKTRVVQTIKLPYRSE